MYPAASWSLNLGGLCFDPRREFLCSITKDASQITVRKINMYDINAYIRVMRLKNTLFWRSGNIPLTCSDERDKICVLVYCFTLFEHLLLRVCFLYTTMKRKGCALGHATSYRKQHTWPQVGSTSLQTQNLRGRVAPRFDNSLARTRNLLALWSSQAPTHGHKIAAAAPEITYSLNNGQMLQCLPFLIREKDLP